MVTDGSFALLTLCLLSLTEACTAELLSRVAAILVFINACAEVLYSLSGLCAEGGVDILRTVPHL